MKERIEELARECGLVKQETHTSIDGKTHAQFWGKLSLNQIQFANAILELAAKECETLEGVKWNMSLSGKPTSLKCAEAIRKLKCS